MSVDAVQNEVAINAVPKRRLIGLRGTAKPLDIQWGKNESVVIYRNLEDVVCG